LAAPPLFVIYNTKGLENQRDANARLFQAERLWIESSRLGHSRIIQTSNTRSLPCTRRRGDLRRNAKFNWWRSNMFSASSRLRA